MKRGSPRPGRTRRCRNISGSGEPGGGGGETGPTSSRFGSRVEVMDPGGRGRSSGDGGRSRRRTRTWGQRRGGGKQGRDRTGRGERTGLGEGGGLAPSLGSCPVPALPAEAVPSRAHPLTRQSLRQDQRPRQQQEEASRPLDPISGSLERRVQSGWTLGNMVPRRWLLAARNRTPNGWTWGRHKCPDKRVETGCEGESESRGDGKAPRWSVPTPDSALDSETWNPCPPGNLGRCPDPSSSAPRAFVSLPESAQGL